MSASERERVQRLLAASPLIDGHNDLAWAIRELADYDLSRADISRHHPPTLTDLPRLKAGGVGAQFWSVFVPTTLPGPEAVVATLEQIDFVHKLAATYPEDTAVARTADDVERIFGSGRLASLLGAEGGHCIAGSLGVLRMFYDLGVRYLTLTHSESVGWADSATDAEQAGGLSEFGREVVAEMNRLGMLVDLSHTSVATMRAAIEASAAPPIFSHSSARAIVDHPRNVPDDVLASLADAGGVCMVTFVPGFVSAGPEGTATLADVVAHVEHVRTVAGVEHVGIGGDYDGCGDMPAGLADVSCYPALFEELATRGWSDAELAALAGGNLLRALREAERVAGVTAAG